MTAISAMKFYVIEEKYKLFMWYIPLLDTNGSGETQTINPGTFCINLLYIIWQHVSVFCKKSSSDRGTEVAQWLKRCATNRKVAGSNPDDVIGIFH